MLLLGAWRGALTGGGEAREASEALARTAPARSSVEALSLRGRAPEHLHPEGGPRESPASRHISPGGSDTPQRPSGGSGPHAPNSGRGRPVGPRRSDRS